MGMVVILTRGLEAALLAEAARAHPQEACGLLWGVRGKGEWRLARIQPAVNVAPEPERHFEIDPATLIAAHRAEREGGAEALLGWYHTHPAGPAQPSPTDAAQAPRDGRVWAIAGGGVVRFWHDGADGFAELPSRRIDG